MADLEPYFPYMFLAGVAVAAIGLIVLLIAAFRTRVWWGIGVTLILPLLGPLFAWRYPRRGLPPLAVMLLGLAVAATPALAMRLVPIDLGPRERIVDGELHLTLTGWDRKSYALLQSKRDAVVLQMANPDVDDTTLGFLAGMDGLRELDLSGTQVTDRGLRQIQGLDRLESLRLRGTAITAAGFRESLAKLPALKQLDLRDTAIERELVDEWKSAKDGRRALR